MFYTNVAGSLFLIVLAAGCTRTVEHEHTIKIEPVNQPVKDDKPTLTAEQQAQIDADIEVVNTEFARLNDEITRNVDANILALTDIELAYRERREDDPVAAAKWYREQLEGKTAADFID